MIGAIKTPANRARAIFARRLVLIRKEYLSIQEYSIKRWIYTSGATKIELSQITNLCN